jgi:hypothetical protein
LAQLFAIGFQVSGIYLSEAAEITGRDKATIHRAMKKGALAFTLDANGQRLIDRAELERWDSSLPRMNSSNRESGSGEQPSDIARLRGELDKEQQKSAHALERLAEIKAQLDDMRGQRDGWQKQAQTLLLSNRVELTATDTATAKRRWWHFGK